MSEQPTYATESCCAVIMLVLQYVDNTAAHAQLLECIMSMKQDVHKVR